MMDLSLIPMDDLIKEMESRCSSFITAYEFHKNKDILSEFRYGEGNWNDAVRLANILNNDILNNWSGELQVLQRIAEEENGV